MSLRDFDPRDAAMRANPYPCLDEIRAHEPVHWNETLRMWMVTTYDEVLAIYKKPRVFSSDRAGTILRRVPEEEHAALGVLADSTKRWMLLVDPPHHTHLRSLVNTAFTPKLIKGLLPKVERIARDLLDAACEGGEPFDAIRDFAFPLPIMVISDMLGFPASDRRLLKRWSDEINAFMACPQPAPGAAAAANGAIAELNQYARDLLVERRKNPQEDLITHLLHARHEGRELSEAEILSTCAMILFGGHGTTTDLVGNGLIALLRNPEQLDIVRRDSDAIPTAVEEVLRYEGPVLFHLRIAAEDVSLRGKDIKRGDAVMLVLGAANRDPSVFEDANVFDVRRADNRHLAFGHGIHFCIGASLARLEGQVAIREIVRRFSRLELASHEELEWRSDGAFRGVRRLPLSFEKGR